jgi:hypothetical protein
MEKILNKQSLLDQLNAYTVNYSIEDFSDTDWYLGELISKNWATFSAHYPIMVEACYHLMERSVSEDFHSYSLIHAIEAENRFSEDIYLIQLFKSLDRKPTYLATNLLCRMINGNYHTHECLKKLTEIANNPSISAYLKQDVQESLARFREEKNTYFED